MRRSFLERARRVEDSDARVDGGDAGGGDAGARGGANGTLVDDAWTDGTACAGTFVRELPGASSSLEAAVVRAMGEVSLGRVFERAGVKTLTRETRGGVMAIDENAVRAATDAALDAAMEAKTRALASHAASGGWRGTATEDSAQGAFQRAVFAKKLHEKIVAGVTLEVRRRAESELRSARRRAQEMDLTGRHEARERLDKQRQVPHEPWFLMETPKEEQQRLRKHAALEAAALEAGSEVPPPPLPANVHVEAVPDPTDESVAGAVKFCFYAVRSHPRPIQKVLDYLFGYSPAVDGEDLEDIAAYAQGLPVSRGKTPRELAVTYATNLDKILGERDKVVLKGLIKNVRDEWATHIKAGQDAVQQLESTPLDSAQDISEQNRDSWLRAMFPTLDWPAQDRRNHRFVEGLGQNLEVTRTITTSRPVPLAIARAALAKRDVTDPHRKTEEVEVDGRLVRHAADGVPIVAPEGFFPSSASIQARKAEAEKFRAAAQAGEDKLAARRRG